VVYGLLVWISWISIFSRHCILVYFVDFVDFDVLAVNFVLVEVVL